MTGVKNLQVTENEDGMRLDRWFKVKFPELAYGRLQKLLRTGQVRVDGARSKANTQIFTGQTIRVPPLMQAVVSSEEGKIKPKPLSKADKTFVHSLVIHKDDDILVIKKPAGLAVQGGSKTTRHLDGLLDGLSFDLEERPRLVHRLDKDTSGVMLLARHRKAASALGHSFKNHTTRKVYWALVVGVPRYEAGEINVPLIKKGHSGQERVRLAERSDTEAMTARTYYQIVDAAGQKMAWLAMMPVTGRTHQLRVHAVALGHPIVGDGKYGGVNAHPGGEIPAQLHLHAHSISFVHPQGQQFHISAELPDHMLRTWRLLNFDMTTEIDFGEFQKD